LLRQPATGLRGDVYLLATLAAQLANEAFAATISINVGRIEEVYS
jgi:hypothetical protein